MPVARTKKYPLSLRVTWRSIPSKDAWDKAFNGSALKDYEQLLIKCVQELLEHLESCARSGEVVDMAQWMKHFS